MSFSSEVKEELSRVVSPARHCRIAEVAALLSMCSRIKESPQGDFFICFQTENEAVARKCFTLLKKTFNINTVVTIHKNTYLKKGNVFSIEVTESDIVRRILQSTKLLRPDHSVQETGMLVNPVVIQSSCCKRAFLRGAFLSSGSISDPRKSYHFEIVCVDEGRAVQLQEIIQSFEIDAKIVKRKKSYVVYVKEGDQIVEMLAIMEANVALMNLENIRILKEMRNSVNRKVNCETANINKTAKAAVKQIEDIELIDKTVGLESLSKGLGEIARLRLKYPEANLKELGMMLTPQVGKSGVNHRLRKLGEIAAELRGRKEELL